MFGGGKPDAFFHEAGGVADAGDVAAVRFNLEIIEIGAAEDDASVGRSWGELKVAAYGGVEANAAGFNSALDGSLKCQDEIRIAV